MTLRYALPAALLARLLTPSAALADPPAPKVCVAVAGDPDESMRASAETLADAVSHREGLRGVADADARAALRGDAITDAARATEVADLAAARRSLRGEDRDAAALDTVSTRLGCGLVVELMARPAGSLVRVYDPVQRAWPASREVTSVDVAVIDQVVLPALAVRTTNATASSDASTPTDASAPADGSTANGTAAQAGPAANSAQPASGQGSSAANRSGTNDRRVAPAQPESRSVWSRAWPWIAVGGVALAVVGVYFLAQEGATTSTTRVTVVHPGVP
ncbi:MAG: hypothetical protein U0326_41730 [Polyangiales bacterium]